MNKKIKHRITTGIFLSSISGLAVCLKGRRNNRKIVDFKHQFYAHRGLHKYPTIPENSMAAFDKAFENGFGIELDVHLCKDGSVVVFHDSKLERVCGVHGVIEEYSYSNAKMLRLFNTNEKIPLLSEVFMAHEYTKPFLIEVKTYKNNAKTLMPKLCEILDEFPNIKFCIQSFDPRVLVWLRKNRPEIIRGQLSSDFEQERSEELTNLTSFILTNLFTNIFTKPDFVSYNYHYRNHLTVKLCKTLWHMPVFNWTIRTREDMTTVLMENNTVIFEGFDPER